MILNKQQLRRIGLGTLAATTIGAGVILASGFPNTGEAGIYTATENETTADSTTEDVLMDIVTDDGNLLNRAGDLDRALADTSAGTAVEAGPAGTEEAAAEEAAAESSELAKLTEVVKPAAEEAEAALTEPQPLTIVQEAMLASDLAPAEGLRYLNSHYVALYRDDGLTDQSNIAEINTEVALLATDGEIALITLDDNTLEPDAIYYLADYLLNEAAVSEEDAGAMLASDGSSASASAGYASPVSSGRGSAIVNTALAMVGPQGGYDCSGWVQEVFRRNGIYVPGTSYDYWGAGYSVSWSQMQPGDIMLFDSYGTGRVEHVGIYIGGGQMVHVNTVRGRIMVQSPGIFTTLGIVRAG